MNLSDFNKLNGLLSKLENAADRAAKEDGCFRKYHSTSIGSIKTMRANLKTIEHGLRTANFISLEEEDAPEGSMRAQTN